jgi:hypothetical protein
MMRSVAGNGTGGVSWRASEIRKTAVQQGHDRKHRARQSTHSIRACTNRVDHARRPRPMWLAIFQT